MNKNTNTHKDLMSSTPAKGAKGKNRAPRYLIKIWYEEPDSCYIAEVPALPGCVTYGDTYSQAAFRVEEAIDAWRDSARKHNDPIPEPDYAAEQIAMYAPIISISKLARRAGLNQNTVASKLRRHTRFSPDEAKAIRKAFDAVI